MQSRIKERLRTITNGRKWSAVEWYAIGAYMCKVRPVRGVARLINPSVLGGPGELDRANHKLHRCSNLRHPHFHASRLFLFTRSAAPNMLTMASFRGMQRHQRNTMLVHSVSDRLLPLLVSAVRRRANEMVYRVDSTPLYDGSIEPLHYLITFTLAASTNKTLPTTFTSPPIP